MLQKAPNEVVWPGISDAFNYNEIYSFKFINIRGYMEYYLDLSKNAGKKKKRMKAFVYDQTALTKASAGMNSSEEPERGDEFILVKEEK